MLVGGISMRAVRLVEAFWKEPKKPILNSLPAASGRLTSASFIAVTPSQTAIGVTLNPPTVCRSYVLLYGLSQRIREALAIDYREHLRVNKR